MLSECWLSMASTLPQTKTGQLFIPFTVTPIRMF